MDEVRDQTITAELPEKKRSGGLRMIIDVLETILLSVILFVGINAVTARIRVDGSSMEPTLHHGQLILVNKLSYRMGEPVLGDVIVFHYPIDPQQEYIKRIIGLPGDQVDINDGKVYVNEQLIEEPYIAASPAYGPASWIVSEGSLFVLGDNRNNSSDSHRWGTVPMEYVVGKAVIIYWPPEYWGVLEHHRPYVSSTTMLRIGK
jgi:signal peptidase I